MTDASSPLRRLGPALAGLAYLAGVFLAGRASAGTLWMLAAISALGLALHWRWGRRPEGALLSAWAPLHLAVIASGSLASPIAPIAAGWLVLVGRVQREAVASAAVAAAVLVPLIHWTSGAAISLTQVAGWLALTIVVALAVLSAGLPRAGIRETNAEPAPTPPVPAPPLRDDPAGEVVLGGSDPIQRTLDLVRLATWADQAVLWRVDEVRRTASAVAVSGRPEGATAPVSLEGHPIEWVVLENVHVRLERGRKNLPSDWAAEMLLVPVDLPKGVLSLAYGSPLTEPPVGEATLGGELLARVADLRATEVASQVDRQRVDGLIDLVHRLPHELDLDAFGLRLAKVIGETLAPDGVAVALWSEERGRGRFIGGAGAGADIGGGFGEGECRLALSAKHGTVLRYDDLRSETPFLPLLHREENPAASSGAAVIAPLQVEGKTQGAVAIWADRGRPFDAETADYLRVLCVLAAPAMSTARRYTELDRRASTDSLTSLPNRVAFDSRLATLANHFDRYERPFGLIILDIDHFKKFNDTWGHEAGDDVLRHVGSLLRSHVREVDLPARLGGEEFVVLFPETGLPEVLDAAERIRSAIGSTPVRWNGRDLGVTVSIGVCACPDSGWAPNDMLGAADAALYRSKAEGRDRVSVAKPGGAKDLEAATLDIPTPRI